MQRKTDAPAGRDLPWWHRAAMAPRRPVLEARARIVAALRALFTQRDFTEVETPALQRSGGLEVHLQMFSTTLTDWARRPVAQYQLHTSPEYAMKRLLVSGWPRIVQFAHVFRNGEASATHHPEFTMLEWYRADPAGDAGQLLGAVLEDTVAAVRAAARAAGVVRLSGPMGDADPFADWQVTPMAALFHEHLGVDLLGYVDAGSGAGDAAGLAAAVAAAGVRVPEGAAFDDAVFAAFAARIEPAIGAGGVPWVVTEWPAPMAALARRSTADPRVAERFEVYVAGHELANAFAELSDPVEQRARFQADAARRQHLYGAPGVIDQDFLAALEHGLPPAAGVALGLDRLVMLATGSGQIRDVLWAPVTLPDRGD